MIIEFLGAAQCVTGSMHVLSVNNEKILLDCGLYQGRRKKAREINENLPFDPKSITSMILSHAHIDHSGNIPLLVKKGYEGNIYCTHATQDLVNVMLRDSAHIQEKDAEYLNKKASRKELPPVRPLYTIKDAENCIHHFIGIGYNRPFAIGNGIKITFLDAGHILGSAIVVIDVEENGRKTRIAFTGDLGRKNLPIIKDPVNVKDADILITESTYGNRVHEPIQNMKNAVKQIIQDTINRKGKVIVPSFSVGRTQELVVVLHELFNEGALPEIPIYVDSPLSVNITEVFRLHPEVFDEMTRETFLINNMDPFGFYRLKYIRHVEDSKKLNNTNEPCIIISASGMCEAGRILHHLKNSVENENNTILVVGYMAENTLGRKIVERAPKLNIFGEEYTLKAKVEILDGFSAHAGQDELLDYINQMDKTRLREIFLVHGEPDECEALKEKLSEAGYKNIHIPARGNTFEL